MKKYEQLEACITDLQKEVERLKGEEKSEMANFPTGLDREEAIKVLNGNVSSLIYAFPWFKTPQGVDYWRKIYEGKEPLTNEDILQLQQWVIFSYQREIDKD
jgi:hypothetical protein